MPSYTYTGPENSITLRGIDFPQGEAVEVSDAEFQKKLDNLPFFDSDKPKEVAKPAAVSDSEKDAEISRLKREVGRLTHEVQSLQRQLDEYGADEVATPVEVSPEEEVISEYTPGEKQSEPEADIPEDWREMHWKRQVVIAKKFTDMEISNQADAVAAIELELERRGN